MIELIEILIGIFVTGSLFYARHFHGTRAMIELTFVFAVTIILAVLFFMEIMRSAAEETENNRGLLKKRLAYQVLAVSTNVFNRIYTHCSEVLKEWEEGEEDDE